MKQMELFKLPKGEKKKKKNRAKSGVAISDVSIISKPEWPYEYITNAVLLPAVAEDLGKHMAIGLDIETLGLDPYLHAVRLVQLSRMGKTYLIDYGRIGTLGPVEDILRDNILKVGHNLKFECEMFSQQLDFELDSLFCTMIADILLKGGERKYGFKLSDLAQEYLGISMDKSGQISDWSGDLSENQLLYAALDSESPLKLHQLLMIKLSREKLKDIAFLEFELIPAVADLELAGIRIDSDKWYDLAYQNERERDVLELKLKNMLDAIQPGKGASFNPRSVPQVKVALAAMGLYVDSTSVDSIKGYRHEYPFVDTLLKYRALQSSCSTFGVGFLDYIQDYTGRIHAEFNQLGSGTGRYSCSAPNLENIPKDNRWRSCFIPEEGFVYSIFDFSQIELRVAACIADDREMIRVFQEGKDIHRMTAAVLCGCSEEDVTPEQRTLAKSCNFGLLYGMSADMLRVYANNNYGVEMTEGEAKSYRRSFFRKYRGLRSWHQEAYGMADREVIELRTIGNRVRRWRDFKPWVTHILNTPVQGTAADGMKAAHIYLYNALKKYGDDARIVNVIHDEFIVEVRESLREEVSSLQQECMVRGMEVFIKEVPILVEGRISNSWGE